MPRPPKKQDVVAAVAPIVPALPAIDANNFKVVRDSVRSLLLLSFPRVFIASRLLLDGRDDARCSRATNPLPAPSSFCIASDRDGDAVPP